MLKKKREEVKMKDFFIADTHFGSEKLRCYESRPFETVEEMDKQLIENWNSLVEKEDTVSNKDNK